MSFIDRNEFQKRIDSYFADVISKDAIYREMEASEKSYPFFNFKFCPRCGVNNYCEHMGVSFNTHTLTYCCECEQSILGLEDSCLVDVCDKCSTDTCQFVNLKNEHCSNIATKEINSQKMCKTHFDHEWELMNNGM